MWNGLYLLRFSVIIFLSNDERNDFMVTNIDAYDLNPAHFTGTRNFYIDLPHICPCCSTAYSSNPSFSGFFKNTLGTMHLYCLFFCPACEDAFLVTYDFIDDMNMLVILLFNILFQITPLRFLINFLNYHPSS